MDVGLALTLAEKLFTVLESGALQELCSKFSYKDDLEELKGTVSTIRAVLHDVDAKQLELGNEFELWIRRLKDALYDVDDLFDELNTITQHRQMVGDGRNKIAEKVRDFFSRSNPLLVGHKSSKEIKKIRDKLNAISDDRRKFGLEKLDYKSIWSKRRETCSHVDEKSIIGRESDKEEIVRMLLDSKIEEDVSFVTIVGIGGLGKTTIAQMVYNDDEIKNTFETMRIWVCVSEDFSLENILAKILPSLRDSACDGLGLQQLQTRVREHIESRRYLLVLDDVWEESRKEWLELQSFLRLGGKGSRVLVTTRSKEVANGVGEYPMYDLPGLSEKHSWELFKLMAFGHKEEKQVECSLVKMGIEIVKKCANVPLFIRVIGSLLYGQDSKKWALFQRNELAKLPEVSKGSESAMAILKLSYYQLTPELKSCFGFCALYPKDYRIEKDQLIGLWIANGCLVPQSEIQTLEDVGEEYFSILLQRCFFQDVREDDYYGRIWSCKVHDLLHDLALHVTREESSLISEPLTRQLDGNIRHLSIVSDKCSVLEMQNDFWAKMAKLRTFIQVLDDRYVRGKICQSSGERIISNSTSLRWLDLSNGLIYKLVKLPNKIDKLIHIRCLDLSRNDELEKLPESITNLRNLQILNLAWCWKLRALPEHLSRLVNLRHLDILGCYSITCMPTGLKNLTCLRRLPVFILGGDSRKAQMSQLEDLKALENLSDELTINVINFSSEETSQVMEGAYLRNKPRIEHLTVRFEGNDKVDGDAQEAILEGLQPKCNLKSVFVKGYRGLKLLQSWEQTTLSHLVTIHLDNLHKVQDLPLLSQLGELKWLSVVDIPNLEYMENDSNCTPSVGPTFFPSLEELSLEDLPKLKGWWRDGIIVDWEAQKELKGNGEGSNEGGGNGYGISSSHVQYFPRLSQLEIIRCSNMTSFPPSPHVETLRLAMANAELKFREKRGMVEDNNGYNLGGGSKGVSYSNNSSGVLSPSPSPLLALEDLYTQNIGFMRHLPEESFQALTTLEFGSCEEQSLSGIEHVFRGCASSLKSLKICECEKLKRLSGGGLEHLTSLQRFVIWRADELEMEENGTPWNSLHALTHLTLRGLPKMENLPEGFQYSTALQSLQIQSCQNLRELPEWLGGLTSLRSLSIVGCPKLTSLPEGLRDLTSLTTLIMRGCPALQERCREPDGEDYPKISHIPHIYVSRCQPSFIRNDDEAIACFT